MQHTPLLRDMGRGEKMGWNSSWVAMRTWKSLILSQTGFSASPSPYVSPLHWGLSEGNPFSSQHLEHLFSSSFFPDLGVPGLFLGFYLFSSACPAFFSLLNAFSGPTSPDGLSCAWCWHWGAWVARAAVSCSGQPQPLLTEPPQSQRHPKQRDFAIWERGPHSSCYHLGWAANREPWSPRAAQSLSLWRADVASAA